MTASGGRPADGGSTRGSEPAPRRGGGPARALALAAFVLYPPLVWFTLSRGGPRLAALVLLAATLPAAVLRLRGLRRVGLDRAAVRGLAPLPFVTVGLLALGAALDRAGFVLAVPAAINAALLLAFGWTLRPGATPMVERFARLTLAAPSPAQLAWCRAWTVVWCAFFAANGAAAAALALRGDLDAWTVYNGFVAYLLVGALIAVEFVWRRRRFGAS